VQRAAAGRVTSVHSIRRVSRSTSFGSEA
jgi:hypothetical protein